MSGEEVQAERLQALMDRLAAGTTAQQLTAEGVEPGLVQLAVLAAQAGQELPTRPAPAFRVRLQAELQAELAARHRQPSRGVWWPRLLPRLAAGLLAVVLVLGSAVVASASSLPGEPLYGVKRAAEQVRLTFAWTHEARAAIQLDIAEARLREIRALREQGLERAGLEREVAMAQQAALEAARAAEDAAVLAAVQERIDRQRAAAGAEDRDPFSSNAAPPTEVIATATELAGTPDLVPSPTGGSAPEQTATRAWPMVVPTAVPTTALATATSAPLPVPSDEPEKPAATAVLPQATSEPTDSPSVGEATLSPGEVRETERAQYATARAATATPWPTRIWPPPRRTRHHREPSPPPRTGGGVPSGTPPPTAGP